MGKKGLPKDLIKKYGITKKAWTEYRKRKGYKTQTTKRNIVTVKRKMRKRNKKKTRRRRDRRLPISGVAGIATTAFAKPYKTWSSPVEALQSGHFDLAAQSALANIIGITLPMGGHTGEVFNPMKVLNPFDFDLGAGWKAAMWTALTASIVKKISPKSKDMVDKVPYLGKIIKFA